MGANADVFKYVPSDCIVVGVPAYIVSGDGKKMKKPLWPLEDGLRLEEPVSLGYAVQSLIGKSP